MNDKDRIKDENEEENKPNVITTQEELRAFSIVKEILQVNERNVENLKYKDNSSYFNIINRVITKWFIRFYSDRDNRSIITRLDSDTVEKLCPNFRVENAPKSNGASRNYINSVEDLLELESLIIACYDEVKE